MKNTTEEKASKYWLAVNGPTCAACPFPAPDIDTSPVPEMLIGYPTKEEQMTALRMFLTAPMEEVRTYMKETIWKRIESGEVVYKQLSKPEPPSAPVRWTLRGKKKSG